jgi:putative spermidine/putrescine transport system permease protein
MTGDFPPTTVAGSARVDAVLQRLTRGSQLLPYLPFAFLILVFFGQPALHIVQYALQDPSSWSRVFARPGTEATLARTLTVAVQVTTICGLLSYIYVTAALRAKGLLRSAFLAAVVVPFLTSILVRTYAWTIVLSEGGPVADALRLILRTETPPRLLYNRTGVLIGMVHVLLPLFALPLYAVMSQMNPELPKAARSLGANKVAVFLLITLPLSLPGAAAGALLVFIQSLGFYVTPALLGGVTDAMAAQVISRSITYPNLDLNAAAILSLALMIAVLFFLAAFRAFYPIEALFVVGANRGRASHRLGRLLARGRHSFRGGVWLGALIRALDGLSRVLSLLPWGGVSLLIAVTMIGYFLLPLVVVVPVSFSGDSFLEFPPQSWSFRWYESVLQSQVWRQAARNSLLVGGLTTLLAMLVGLPLAFALVRSHASDRLKGLVMLVLSLPAILPVIVISIGVFVLFLERGMLGNRWALAATYATIALPYVAIIAASALRDFDVRVEHASRSLGAGAVDTMRSVTLPILTPAIASGALFTFLFCLDELLIAQSVTDASSSTLAIRVWLGANEQISPELASFSTISLALTLILAMLLQVVRRRRADLRRLRR